MKRSININYHIKLIFLTLILICPITLFSCEKGDYSGSETVIVDVTVPTEKAPRDTPEQTEVPTKAPAPSDTSTPAPTAEPTATPFPVYTEKYADLVKKYTVTYPGYKEKNRKAPAHVSKLPGARFTRYESGWYRNDSDSGTATLMFTGDLMCQRVQQQIALRKFGEYNFNSSFSCVKPLFENADLVIGNLETTLCSRSPYMSEQNRVDNMPHCNAPATFANALRYAGFDGVVMSNNHCCDSGVYGILDTIDNVNDYELMHTGTYADKSEKRYLLVDVNGIKIAIMSYSNGFNTKEFFMTQEGQDVMLNMYYPENVRRDVADARADGAEYIIAYNHTGTEYTNQENERQRRFVRQMADAGVDYVLNSHPHALQRYDILTASDGRKVPVVYSMGNFSSYMKQDVTKDTIILQVTLTKKGDKIEMNDGYYPCRVMYYNKIEYCIVPVLPDYMDGNTSGTLKSAYKRIKGVIGDKIDCLGSVK